MKIVLAALNAKYVHSNLAVYDIEAYAKEQFHKAEKGESLQDIPEIVVREYTINHNLNQILQSLYQEKASVIAFSCYIWNIHEILTIAKELHKVSPKTHLWLGGPEVSYDCEDILNRHPYIEGIMRGEGEATFYELVMYWCQPKNTVNMTDVKTHIELKDISGITYRDGEQSIRVNPVRPLLSLDEIPFIYHDLKPFEHKILYYETSRGCPFSCSYCLSSIDKSVRFRSMELVQKELQFFLDAKVPQVKFIDRTFNCKREHALAIWQYLVLHDNGITNFHFEVAADLIGEPEFAVFENMRPGLIQLEIGLQSTNQKTIHEIRRVMDVEKVKNTLLRIREFGNIHQHLDLIAGLPYEDFASFQNSFDEAYGMKPNQLQLGFLKVLKGSYMGEQLKAYDLKHQDTQPYEVLSTKWLSYDEVLKLKQVEEIVELYYNSDQFEHVLPYVVSMFRRPFDFYEAFGQYYEKMHYFDIGLKRENRYVVLRDFCQLWFGRVEMEQDWDLEVFDSLLTFDYYLRENAKSRPAWNPTLPIEKALYQQFFKNGGTKAYSLLSDRYDSKAAAGSMHLEPIVKAAIPWILREKEFLLVEDNVPESVETGIYYCLFDYTNRNPLTKDGKVVILQSITDEA